MSALITASDITAVVLAGGFGTRVKHLLPDIPKPMAQVCGQPFLEWVLLYLARQGITKAVLSTGHLSEVIEKHFSRAVVPTMTIRCVKESTPLGTAGGFLHAARTSGGKPDAWLVLNGDSLVFADMAGAIADMAEKVTGVLVGCEVPDASRYGTLHMDAKRTLIAFEEKRPGSGIINAGIYLLRHEALNGFPDKRPLSFETDVFPALAARKRLLKVHPVRAPFLDIGTPETLGQAEAFIQQNRAQFGVE